MSTNVEERHGLAEEDCSRTLEPAYGRVGTSGVGAVRWPRVVLEAGLLLAIAMSVIAFGGTEPIPFALAQCLLYGLLAVLLFSHHDGHRLQLPWLAPTILLGYYGMYLLPLPAWLLAGRFDANRGVAKSGFATLSFNAHATVRHGLLFLACLAVFYVGLTLFCQRQARQRVVVTLVGIGVAEAFLCLIQLPSGRSEIFLGVSTTGTYVNRNHLAGLLEMILPLALAMAFYYVGSGRKAREGGEEEIAIRPLPRPDWQKTAFFSFLAVVLFLGLVFSGSRMGILSALVSLAAVGFLFLSSTGRPSTGVSLLLLVLTGSLLLAAWVGLAPVMERFVALKQEFGMEEVGRWAVWKDTVGLIKRYPLLGVGPGVYDVALTQVQASHLDRFINYAHNDYLQVAAEFGVLGAFLVFGLVFFVFGRIIRRLYRETDRLGWAVSLGTAGGLLALLMHGLTDGNLYIPANALVFSLLLSFGYSTARRESSQP